MTESQSMLKSSPVLFRNSAMLSGLKRILFLLVVAAALLIVSRVERDTRITLEQTQPLALITALLLSLIALRGIVQIGVILVNQRVWFAWRAGWGVVGWLGVAGSLAGLVLLMLTKESEDKTFPIAGAVRAVEAVIPLVVGIQSAFLLSPDDEPALEVMMACPRKIAWLLLERLLVLLSAQTLIALAGTVVSLAINREQDVFVMLVRWLAPMMLFSGLGAYITVRSRQPAFSVALIGLLWFVFTFMGFALLPGNPTFWPLSLAQPFFWPLHAYLQPGDLLVEYYWLNRLVVGALGICLLMLTARHVNDEEQILLGIRPKQTQKGE